MSLVLWEHPEATAEYVAATGWYETRGQGLGVGLIDQVEAAQKRILEWPDAWPAFPGWERVPLVRTAKVAVYPYRISYVVRGTQVAILAYAHTSREPGYWHHRYDD